MSIFELHLLYDRRWNMRTIQSTDQISNGTRRAIASSACVARLHLTIMRAFKPMRHSRERTLGVN